MALQVIDDNLKIIFCLLIFLIKIKNISINKSLKCVFLH